MSLAAYREDQETLEAFQSGLTRLKRGGRGEKKRKGHGPGHYMYKRLNSKRSMVRRGADGEPRMRREREVRNTEEGVKRWGVGGREVWWEGFVKR